MIEIEEKGCWPHVDSYVNVCPSCNCMFYGPKRAPSCWVCYGPEGRAWWERQHETTTPAKPI